MLPNRSRTVVPLLEVIEPNARNQTCEPSRCSQRPSRRVCFWAPSHMHQMHPAAATEAPGNPRSSRPRVFRGTSRPSNESRWQHPSTIPSLIGLLRSGLAQRRPPRGVSTASNESRRQYPSTIPSLIGLLRSGLARRRSSAKGACSYARGREQQPRSAGICRGNQAQSARRRLDSNRSISSVEFAEGACI
jgi:hypothetical protein